MSSNQDLVLRIIREHPGLTSREIHEMQFPDRNFMTNKVTLKICSSLLKYGLIERRVKIEECMTYGHSVYKNRRSTNVKVARWYAVNRPHRAALLQPDGYAPYAAGMLSSGVHRCAYVVYRTYAGAPGPVFPVVL